MINNPFRARRIGLKPRGAESSVIVYAPSGISLASDLKTRVKHQEGRRVGSQLEPGRGTRSANAIIKAKMDAKKRGTGSVNDC
jgi:hypothetical protein